jgi:hypothetical protein
MQKQDIFRQAPLGIFDRKGDEIREGDILAWTSEMEGPDDEPETTVCVVRWHRNKSAFCLRELDGWDPFTQYSYMRGGTYIILGNCYDNPEIAEKWERLGVSNSSIHTGNFLSPPVPCSCFPTAAINACVGAGIAKAFGNQKLVEKMAQAGECWKWGACIDEPAVLNILRAELDVDFVQADLEDVIEEGGIATIKIGSGAHAFHAAAVFLIDGDPYTVNANIGVENRYVRPLFDISEIARSDDPEDHRDYVLLRNS